MAATDRHHGKSGAIYMSITGSGVPSPAVSLTAWSLDLSKDVVDVTAFLDTNKVKVVGLSNTEGTFDGIWDDAFDNLFVAIDSADGVNLILYPDLTNEPTKYWRGPAWLDGSINTSNTDAVKISGKFVARGAWSRNS